MILIDVDFALLGQHYDFRVDETIPVSRIVEEMVNMISSTEHLPISKDSSFFMLCQCSQHKILMPHTTLADNGVQSADTLLLI